MRIAFAALIGASVIATSSVVAAAPAATDNSYQQSERIANDHLKTFDTLDFDVFSKQKWDRLHESHTDDVTVFWPDGHATHGIDKHIADMKYMFSYAPDTRIKVHPVKIAQRDWTAVIGVMEGTFTKPMFMPDGKVIPPTGKAFRINMATVSHWNGQGKMSEEYLFWDNQTYLKQLGVGN